MDGGAPKAVAVVNNHLHRFFSHASLHGVKCSAFPSQGHHAGSGLKERKGISLALFCSEQHLSFLKKPCRSPKLNSTDFQKGSSSGKREQRADTRPQGPLSTRQAQHRS
jgi:hypothetical protein